MTNLELLALLCLVDAPRAAASAIKPSAAATAATAAPKLRARRASERPLQRAARHLRRRTLTAALKKAR